MSKLALAPLAAALAAAATADAGDEGAFVLHNPSSTTIKYQIKWGGGPWKSYTVSPNSRRAHSHDLDRFGLVPTPRVRFDNIGGDGRVTFKTYNMKTYEVFNMFSGKPYTFRWSRDGREVALFLGRP